jgi:hypothetical protein
VRWPSRSQHRVINGLVALYFGTPTQRCACPNAGEPPRAQDDELSASSGGRARRFYAHRMRVTPRLVCSTMVIAAFAIGMPITAFATTSSTMSGQEAFNIKVAKRDLRSLKTTFGDLREPKRPRGFRLVRVSSGGIGADLEWHRVRDDGFVHLWQSHDTSALGDKDPADPSTGTPITINGAPWVHNTINACGSTTCLSHRYEDGDVVSLNGTLGLERMTRVAATL